MARSRPARRARRGHTAIAIGATMLVSFATTACDRWKAPFRVESHDASQISARTALPASGFRVGWTSNTVPPTMDRGSSADVRIAFTNLGDAVWPDVAAGDPAAHDGGFAVRLAYEWAPAAAPAAKPSHRVDLPRPVRPGETMMLLVPLQAPDQPGAYRVTFALLQELVVWFDDKGAPTLVVPVTVR